MDKIYKLLRNNQQTGPYTLGELAQLGLKPFDLVWADGHTAGWVHPYEVEALVPYLSVAEEEPVEAVPTASATDAESADSPAVVQEPEKTPVITTNIFISLPAGANGSKPVSSVHMIVPAPVAGEETREQMLERKAQALRQRVEALAAQNKVQDLEPTLDTRYSRSLDDIKEEYSYWMQEQKDRRLWLGFTKRQWTTAALLVLIGAVAFAVLKWLGAPIQPSPVPVMSQAPVESLEPAASAGQEAGVADLKPEKQSVINTEVSDSTSQALDKLEQDNKLIEQDLKRFEGTAKPTAPKPAQEISPPQEAIQTQSSQNKTLAGGANHTGTKITSKPADSPVRAVAFRPESKVPQPVPDNARKQDTLNTHRQVSTTQAKVVNQTVSKETSRPAAPPVSMVSSRPDPKLPFSKQIDVRARYQKVARGRGFEGVELMLRNNSRKVLKTVAVDVIYYNESGRQLGKEIVYFNNVYPGVSLTLTAPGHKRAVKATHHMGLISTSDAVYMAAQ